MENQQNTAPLGQFVNIRNLVLQAEAQLTDCENLVTDLEYTIIDSVERVYDSQEEVNEDIQDIANLLDLQEGNYNTMRHNIYILQRILHTPNLSNRGIYRYNLEEVDTLLQHYIYNLQQCGIQTENGIQRINQLQQEQANFGVVGQGRTPKDNSEKAKKKNEAERKRYQRIRERKLEYEKTRREEGLKTIQTPEQTKAYRERIKQDPEKRKRLQEQKNASARRLLQNPENRRKKKEQQLYQELAELLNEPEPQPEPEPQLTQEVQDMENLYQELMTGSGPIFSRPRQNTPVAAVIPNEIQEAMDVFPVLSRQEQWIRGVIGNFIQSVPHFENINFLDFLEMQQLREAFRRFVITTLPNIQESPIFNLLLNEFQNEMDYLQNERQRGNGRPKKTHQVQSILFDKSKFLPQQAVMWIHQNGYKVKKLDETKKMLRFRQVAPSSLRKKGLSKFITKKLGNSGIELIIAYH